MPLWAFEILLFEVQCG